jgi:hypothetical protein
MLSLISSQSAGESKLVANFLELIGKGKYNKAADAWLTLLNQVGNGKRDITVEELTKLSVQPSKAFKKVGLCPFCSYTSVPFCCVLFVLRFSWFVRTLLLVMEQGFYGPWMYNRGPHVENRARHSKRGVVFLLFCVICFFLPFTSRLCFLIVYGYSSDERP